jgi:hypothetical protein
VNWLVVGVIAAVEAVLVAVLFGGPIKEARVRVLVAILAVGIPFLVGFLANSSTSGVKSTPPTTVPSKPTLANTTTTASPGATAAWLDEMNPIGDQPVYPPPPFTVYGRPIPHTVAVYVSIPIGATELVYDIGARYAKFNVDFAIDDRDFPGPVHFEVFGDDKPLMSVDANSALREVHRTITVTRVQKLTLTSSTTYPGARIAGYGNAELVP